jgi:hypothetical protein
MTIRNASKADLDVEIADDDHWENVVAKVGKQNKRLVIPVLYRKKRIFTVLRSFLMFAMYILFIKYNYIQRPLGHSTNHYTEYVPLIHFSSIFNFLKGKPYNLIST